MRQLSTIFLSIIFFTLLFAQPSYSALRGGIDYSIPIEYRNLSENELQKKASYHYFEAIKAKDGVITDDITDALNLYTILQNVNPDNVEYSIKLGILYGKIGKDRYAKGNLYRAISINDNNPAAYYQLGEFYYKRTSYKKALKFYTIAYQKGYSKDYDTLYKLGDIYEKFGDTKEALKYLKEASLQSPNSELDSKIKRVETFDSINKEYYTK
ncbi:MAG: tetratricopeptide repeat protein [bacterium]|nr:tetratricopeptide repeat protein [bacterium]